MRKALFAFVLLTTATRAQEFVPASDSRISIVGRADSSDPARPRLAYPGTAIRFRFTGPSASAAFTASSDTVSLIVVLDHAEPRIVHVPKGASELPLGDGVGAGPHTAEIVKRTETWQGILTFTGIRLSKDGVLLHAPVLPVRKLMFIGDSVTCGDGVDNYPTCTKDKSISSNAYDTYGLVLGRRLDAQVHLVCYGGRGVVRDYRGRRDVLNAA